MVKWGVVVWQQCDRSDHFLLIFLAVRKDDMTAETHNPQPNWGIPEFRHFYTRLRERWMVDATCKRNKVLWNGFSMSRKPPNFVFLCVFETNHTTLQLSLCSCFIRVQHIHSTWTPKQHNLSTRRIPVGENNYKPLFLFEILRGLSEYGSNQEIPKNIKIKGWRRMKVHTRRNEWM